MKTAVIDQRVKPIDEDIEGTVVEIKTDDVVEVKWDDGLVAPAWLANLLEVE